MMRVGDSRSVLARAMGFPNRILVPEFAFQMELDEGLFEKVDRRIISLVVDRLCCQNTGYHILISNLKRYRLLFLETHVAATMTAHS